MFGLSLMAHDPRELLIPDQGYGITEDQWLALERAYGLDAPPPCVIYDGSGEFCVATSARQFPNRSASVNCCSAK